MLGDLKKYFNSLLLSRPYPSFYFVNFIGWFSFIAINELLMEFQYSDQMTFKSHSANILQWMVGYFITIILRIFYKNLYLKKIFTWKKITTILVLSLAASFLFFTFSQVVYSLFYYPNVLEAFVEIYTIKQMSIKLSQLLPIMMAWSMLYFGIKLWIDISAEKERAEKADLLAQSAQLQMLRYQVNPHFLFNSFSSLRALIRKNAEAATDMVGKLSEFYRYSLITKSNSEVPLQNEIEALQFYSDIEKIRFEDKVDFSFNIEDKTKQFLIPSFIIHPLFENAVKYGLLTSKLPLIVKVNTFIEDETLTIEIINSGRWYKKNASNAKIGTGTGLQNINDRLSLLFPGRHNLEVNETDGFVKTILKLTRESNEEV